MPFLEIFLLSIALAADAFTVGTTVGLRHRRGRQIFRLAFHFGLFQSLMAAAGALAGTFVVGYLENLDHWVAFILLVIVGVRMIYSAAQGSDEELARLDLTRGLTMVGLSVAVSIDAFAAGIGLPATGVPLPLAVTTIGVVAALATVIAMKGAGKVPLHFGQRLEVVAGLFLIGFGGWILLDHLY